MKVSLEICLRSNRCEKKVTINCLLLHYIFLPWGLFYSLLNSLWVGIQYCETDTVKANIYLTLHQFWNPERRVFVKSAYHFVHHMLTGVWISIFSGELSVKRWKNSKKVSWHRERTESWKEVVWFMLGIICKTWEKNLNSVFDFLLIFCNQH